MANNATLKSSTVLDEEKKTAQQGTAYQPSDSVNKAQSMLQEQLAQKPAAYQSPWQTQLNDIMGKIMNREKFQYDLNGDALAKQYQEQFTRQGKMAMMDTMGQAAALTGGYGNSYAQQAGQQAYQGYLQQMNDKIPELYQLALDAHTRDGENLQNQFALLSAQDERDYGRHRDQVSDWQSQRNFLTDQYNSERSFDYGKFADDRAFGYQQDRDAVADQQWQASYDEDKRRYDQEYEDAKKAKTSSGGGSRSTAKTSGIPDSLITWLEDHVGSNSDVARYLDAQVAAGNITADQADQLYGIYVTEEDEEPAGGSGIGRIHGGISGSFASKAFASKSF